jgi:hypothetical protein
MKVTIKVTRINILESSQVLAPQSNQNTACQRLHGITIIRRNWLDIVPRFHKASILPTDTDCEGEQTLS